MDNGYTPAECLSQNPAVMYSKNLNSARAHRMTQLVRNEESTIANNQKPLLL